ncbi:PIG-L deacetylase family protein [Orrella dioscoreae]|uniref:PIG-L deacetylase family protein n=1 Tax=Orrella dioscoreae TaxID=1851544 RepID=UPI000831938E|nr:PIG-L family deacetylase [Orrella dioscoreae]
MDAVNSRVIEGPGTSARQWQAWEAMHPPTPISAEALVPQGRRAVVVAPHPDDEVLGTGGLLMQLSQAGRDILLVAATDGEASHPGSTRWPVDTLARVRAQESAAALAVLGVHASTLRLGLADGGLASQEASLRASLLRCVRAGDVVFAPWRLDGHPDHEAVTRAAFTAARVNCARVVEVPIWGWHWCTPGDPRLPWDHALAVALSPTQLQAKRLAIQQFRSQVEPDPSTGRPAILPPHVIARQLRPSEVVLT